MKPAQQAKSNVQKRLIFKANLDESANGPKIVHGDEPINVQWIEKMSIKNLEIKDTSQKDELSLQVPQKIRTVKIAHVLITEDDADDTCSVNISNTKNLN